MQRATLFQGPFLSSWPLQSQGVSRPFFPERQEKEAPMALNPSYITSLLALQKVFQMPTLISSHLAETLVC